MQDIDDLEINSLFRALQVLIFSCAPSTFSGHKIVYTSMKTTTSLL